MIRPKGNPLLLFAVIVSLCSVVFGQTKTEYYPRYFNKQNKQLSENIISDLLLDESGRLWIASPNGLFHFDGSQISPYPSKIPERITKIYQNERKELFINCIDRKTYKISRDTFIENLNYSASDFPPFHHILYSINLPLGNWLWNQAKDSLKGATAFNIFPNKSVYIRRNNNIYRFENNHYQLIQSSNSIIKDIFYQNNYWILKANSNELINISKAGANPISLPIKTIEIDKARWFIDNNETPVIIHQNKAWILNTDKGGETYYWKLISEEIPTDITIFNALYSQQLDKLFIGTFAYGLLIYSKSNFSIYQHKPPKNNLDLYQYYLQIPLRNGQFVADYPGQFTNTPAHFRDFFKNNNLSYSYHYINDQTILGKSDNYYYTLDLNTLTPKKVGKNIKPMGQNQSYINFQGTTYILNSHGIFIYDSRNDTVIQKIKTPIGYGLVNQSMVINNKIWLAYCGGLMIYDPKVNQIRHIKKSTCFRYFYRHNQRIIVTTYGEGLFSIDTVNLSLQKLKSDHYGSLLRTHFLIKDKNNFVWASTNDGLLRFSAKSFQKVVEGGDFMPQPQYFDYNDGLPTDEMNGGAYPAYLNFGDSIYSIPSLMGIIQFRPVKDFPYRISGQSIHIKRVTGFGKTLRIQDGKLKLTNNINEIKFNIQTVHWANPKSLNLYYRIDDTLAYIPYNEITRVNILVGKPGLHNLQFLYIDDNGKENVVLNIQITKEKPWYFQTLYLIIFSIILVVVIGFIAWIKTRNTERKNKKLVEIIREKTQEITKINGELMVKVEELTQLNKINGIYISVINHDLFAPIKYINVVGDKVHEYQKRLKKADILSHLELIINSTKRLEILCSNILNERSSGNSFTSVQPDVPIRSMVADLQSFVKIGLQINNNELIARIPAKATASTSKSALNIILTNLISNANRFTKNGTISIHYHKQSDFHYIEVKDTGNGMQPDVLEKIQNRTLRVNHKDSSELQSYGIGYSLIFKMLDIIKGDMKVASTPLKGTSVTIIFPDLPA